MKLKDLTKDQRSLLLFFETCAVDYSGLIEGIRMNADDFKIAEDWNESGFIEFGRVCFEDIKKMFKKKAHWCSLSKDAWKLAHEERLARAIRIVEKRTWRKTKEL